MNTHTDSWRPTPRRGLGDIGGKTVVVVLLVIILALAGAGLYRLFIADTSKREDDAIADVARRVADTYCLRVEGTTAGGSSVPDTPYSGTMCGAGMKGTLQISGRQPADIVTAGVAAYVHGDDFVWTEMAVAAPGGVTTWAALPDNPMAGPFTFTPSRIAAAIDRGRTGVGTGGMGFVDYGDVSVRADEKTTTLHVFAGGERWRLSTLAPGATHEVERAIVEATATPWFVEDRAGVLVLVGPDDHMPPPPPEHLDEMPVPEGEEPPPAE